MLQLNDYEVYDWVGDFDFREEAMKSSRARRIIFSRFEIRLPIATLNLAKLVPNIKLDHSAESLGALDVWLKNTIDSFVASDRKSLPFYDIERNPDGRLPNSPTVFNALPPVIRSIVTDVCIYAGECRQKIFTSLHWAPSDGKRGLHYYSAGFPGLIGVPKLFEMNYGEVGNILSFVAQYCSRFHMNEAARFPYDISFLRDLERDVAEARDLGILPERVT